MSKLAQPLREMVEPDQDYKKWYLFPMPGERKPSVMYKYEIDTEVLVKQRFRGHIEKMVKRLAADRRAGGDPKYHGSRTIDEWAAIFGCKPGTVSRYRSQIEAVFAKANINAYEEILEEVVGNGYIGVRIRPEVTLARPKPATSICVTGADPDLSSASPLLQASSG